LSTNHHYGNPSTRFSVEPIFAGQGLGVSTAQLFTTVGCIYGTYGGIYILHEKKSRREFTWITFGSILIVLASAVTGFIAQLAVLL
ncbi:GRP family sugar transporter, partial [Limosilactobacillus fermentum]|uniref:GRP family sugar transporter n=1 Tax=Limosilactobacillus fermentum TaxID=1613 RepID=UPI003F7ECE51